ncbi:AraC family transcriptional regulator [Rhodococcus sp. IEGM 1381]|uniref:AraC family transcriptional regulator n=1 Tax=Rhodococcus sp. IEGM 1381 TaxID=3047085 RepID=UPI0024B688CD|nr:AraC family transcriptional regulator [Rhodococcus sp. IEGM 1381]MDI9894534.1 AraC family transcriptional regulator [Rhodococcus sp. IEGM 1381]
MNGSDLYLPSGTKAASRLIKTHDLDEAQALITRVYIPHTLRSRDGYPLDFKLNFLQSHQLTLGHLNYGADAELLVPAMENNYHINLTLRGASTVSQAGRSGHSQALRTGVAFGPMHDFTVRWSPEAIQYAIKLPRQILDEHLAALLNHPIDGVIDFELIFDLASTPGQNFLSAVNFLRAELARPGGLATSPMARGQLESFVMTQALLAVPHRYTHELTTPTKPANRSRVRDVIDHIDSRPESELTMATMAKMAGVSARALQKGFMATVGMPPMAYVRKVRLDRVRGELVSTAGRKSITDVASYWGFSHLSRFSAFYKKQFGESPSDTVRKTLA